MEKKARSVNKLTHHFRMFYRFSLFLAASFLSSCTITPEPRNADLTVHYRGKLVHEAKRDNKADLKPVLAPLKYNLPEDLKTALESNTRPLIVIYAADWCKPCRVLNDILIKKGWRNSVIILNADNEFAIGLMTKFGANGVPSMHVITPYNKLLLFRGADSILQVLSLIHNP